MKLIAALTVSVSLLAQTGQPTPHSVVAVRHWSLTDVTRVAIEITGDFTFRTDRLHNPERVYYDITNAVPLINGKRAYVETLDDKFLQRIRVAETVPGVTRVVLDLNGTIEAKASTLSSPNRLIVELRRGSGPAIPTESAVRPNTRIDNARPDGAIPPVSLPVSPHKDPAPLPTPAPVLVAPPLSAATKPESPAAVAADVSALPVSRPEMPVPAPSTESVRPAAKPEIHAAPPATAPPSPEETAQAARHTSSGQNSLVRTLGLKLNRVVIDPGHGGHDEGTRGAKGVLEKDVVLDVAKRVGKLIEERLNAEVVYTRSDDTFIPLEGRTALANEKKADLFLSIHANSSSVPSIAGVETYYLNITGSHDSMDVALRENRTAQKSIFELQDIVRKIALYDKSEESQEFAKRVQASLFAFSAHNYPAIHDRGVKSAPFIVLIGANMPSVLAEIGFLTNPREEANLTKPDYLAKLAEALYKGVERYAQSLSHFQVAAKP